MMIALGDQPSLLSKIPGFDQLAKVRKLRGMDMAELFGDLFDLPDEDAGEDEDEAEEQPGPTRARREYFADVKKPAASPKKPPDKSKKKDQAKARKQARRKNRR